MMYFCNSKRVLMLWITWVVYCTFTTSLAASNAGTPINLMKLQQDDVKRAADCGGTYNTSQTSIESPNYPGSYPSSVTCSWTVVAGVGEVIFMTFDPFNIDGAGDHLEVYDFTPKGDLALLSTLEGVRDRFIVISSSNKLLIKLISSEQSTATERRSFHATYTTKGCGGTYTDQKAGVIASPLYNAKLQPKASDLTCHWKVQAELPKKISLSFSPKVSFPQGGLFTIFDGPGEMSPVLLNITADKPSHDVLSTQSAVVIKYTFQADVATPDFGVVFTSITANCGGFLTVSSTTSVTINSPNFPQAYSNNLDCRWILYASNSKAIIARFAYFNITNSNDIVVINGGGSRDSQQLGRFMGGDTPDDFDAVITNSQYLWIKYTSDELGNSGTFQLDVVPQDTPALITAASSITFPRDQPVTYLFQAQPKQQSVLVPVGVSCSFTSQAKVSFYEGSTVSAVMIGVWNTHKPYIVFSNGDKMLAVATDMNKNSYCKAKYSPSDRVYFYNSFGNDGSYRQPLIVEDGRANGWHIHSNQSGILELTLSELDLRSNEGLNLYSGPGDNFELIGAFNKSWRGGGYTVHLPAEKDSFLRYFYELGPLRTFLYSGSYTEILNCRQFVSKSSGTITSPKFPDLYPLNAECLWNIQVKKGQRLHITFDFFRIFPAHNIFLSDQPILLTENNLSKKLRYDAPSVIYNYSGYDVPDDVIWENEELFITMDSRESKGFSGVDQGFSLQYQAVDCGGNITSAKGSISTPGYPQRLPLNVVCVWIIHLPKNNKASKNQTVIRLNYDKEFTKDMSASNYVKILDGSNSRAPALAFSNSSKSVLSREGVVMVQYIFSGSQFSSSGFPFKLEFVTAECNRTCDNGLCLHDDWLCDRVDQCGDNSDEDICADMIPNCASIKIHKNDGKVDLWILIASVTGAFLLAVFFTLAAVAVVKRFRTRTTRSYRALSINAADGSEHE